MLKYVELCVDLRKGKIVKEGLHQYKNIAQNTSVNTIEVFGFEFNTCLCYIVSMLISLSSTTSSLSTDSWNWQSRR